MHQYQERNAEDDQKTRRKASCKTDMESVGLKVEDVLERTMWKREIKKTFREPQMMGKD